MSTNPIHHHAIVTQPTLSDISPITRIQNNQRIWSTTLCDCAKDEETWCCWLVHARTMQSLEFGKSINQVLKFWCFIIFLILSLILGGPLVTILYSTVVGSYLAFERSVYRSKIRDKYSIYGNPTDDFLFHCCCSCCSVCQEAREAKLNKSTLLDFCSGEKLSDEAFEHVVENDAILGGTFLSHINTVSQTSKIILTLCGFVAVLSLLGLIASGRPQNIVVLLLVFLQPLLILYLLYWRSRRKFASLDYVIKLFAVGFWFTTVQSLILEMIVQGILIIILSPFLGRDVFPRPQQDPNQKPNDGFISGKSQLSNIMSDILISLFQYYSSTNNPQFANNYIPFDTISSNITSISVNGTDNSVELQREAMKSHLVAVIIGLFLLSFVVAAGVEETMKHFVVRCCQFPVQLTNPHTVLVYLLSGALGFATAENIEYVFGTTSSPIPGYSVFVGELFVLLIRVAMPIHVICSVLQAANLSKVMIGIQRLGLFQILLPAILLHGTFDFVLFLLSTLQFIENDADSSYDIISIVMSIVITIGGIIWAYLSFSNVQKIYDSGYSASRSDDFVGNENL